VKREAYFVLRISYFVGAGPERRSGLEG